ncbi:unnamed protein product [Pseudo-nitzschia multistriata]|uniref:Uncharacterized protein n=1 Tax=Pseudo-nitzschia multistriata TaxID=183589 RepID=A0A448Z051_9STRA|nr:unnamed protein product [Pseudo-nitzschia multistriata]
MCLAGSERIDGAAVGNAGLKAAVRGSSKGRGGGGRLARENRHRFRGLVARVCARVCVFHAFVACDANQVAAAVGIGITIAIGTIAAISIAVINGDALGDEKGRSAAGIHAFGGVCSNRAVAPGNPRFVVLLGILACHALRVARHFLRDELGETQEHPSGIIVVLVFAIERFGLSPGIRVVRGRRTGRIA